MLRKDRDHIEEVVSLATGELSFLRPRDPEALLDEEQFAERDEFMPYWAELWPSGVALAREMDGRSLRGARVLELGCGLAVPSVVAALAGGRVLATDWSQEALELAAENARRNGARLETAIVDWREPDVLLERAPWDLVLAADVLYEARNTEPLLALLQGLGGELWLADPGRTTAEDFLGRAEGSHLGTTRRGAVSIHRYRSCARPGPSPAPAEGSRAASGSRTTSLTSTSSGSP